MRYLVTGGAGFIGSHLVDALASRGDEVLILDDLSTGRRQNVQHMLDSGNVELVEGSVMDGALVDDCVRSVDRCFHLASAVGVQLVMDRPLDTLLTNVNGTQNVMSAAARHDRWLLYTSTSEVYGKQSRTPLTENSDCLLGSPAKRRWSYAIAKAFGEALAHTLHAEGGAPMVVTRLFNVVGPRQSDRYGMVVPRLVRQAMSGTDLTVFGNGTQMRCFLHVNDAVHGLLLLAETDNCRGRVFNIGSNEEVSIMGLARRVRELAGSNSEIVTVPYDEAYEEGFEDMPRRVPDISKVSALTGFRPTMPLDGILQSVIEYYSGRQSDGRS